MLAGGRGIDGLDRLDIRLVALLGLALLPIGIIAMVQTYRVIDNADRIAHEALIGTTLSAVTEERETLIGLRGAAEAAANIMPSILDRPDQCANYMADFISRFADVAFAGYVDSDGIVRCGSAGTGRDVSDRPLYKRFADEARPFFMAVDGAISQRAVIVVVQPVAPGDPGQGFVALSVPQFPLELNLDNSLPTEPIATFTLSAEGVDLTTISSDAADQSMADLAPSNGSYVDLLRDTPYYAEDRTVSGIDAIYSVVPIIPNEVYGLSIWRAAGVTTGGLNAASAILFPLLMWLVSIGVAYFAVHRLVVRHIRRLRLRIRAFTTSRRILPPESPGDLPSELRDVVEAFDQLTERIVRDEADLENSLHEKDVLLKEVHHRVKNNLQLISSMMNMQLRKANSPETRELLLRLQDRILGLATIHRNLYRASVLSQVQADTLIRDLIEQVADPATLADNGIDLDVSVAPVALYPDQAVPLSLLVTEIMANALKYVGVPSDGRAYIRLRLSETDECVSLRCVNSVGTPLADKSDQLATGLGRQLIQAFVMQLDGRMRQEQTDAEYRFQLDFTASDFTQDL